MAQYYNIVTNASGTLTIEEVQRVCSVEGQSVQFVVEDLNNGLNGSPQLLAYAAAPQSSEQTVFAPHTINLSGQLATNHIDQRQNVYIIKTNDITQPQNIVKNTVSTQLVGENVVNIVESRGSSKIPLNNTSPGQNMQWVKMPENNINFDAMVKQNTLAPIKSPGLMRNQQQTNIPPQVALNAQGQCQPSQHPGLIQTAKKSPGRLCQIKSRPPIANTVPSAVVAAATSSCPQQVGNLANSVNDRAVNPNLVNNRNSNTAFRSKMYGPNGPEAIQPVVRQGRNVIRPDTPLPRNPLPLPMPKIPYVRKLSEGEYLSEKIKQAKLKQNPNPKAQMAMSPEFQRQILQQNHPQRQQQIGTNITQQQRQQLTLTPQQQRQQVSNSPVSRQQNTPTNAGQQRQQQMVLTPQQQAQLQRQPMLMTTQQRQHHQIQACPVHQEMEVDPPENSQESGSTRQQSCGSHTDSEPSSSPSATYVQKCIDNPQTCIVQRQIDSSTVKMLVILLNGEQRLITFDIPTEDCTVQDLLEQANIPFCSDTTVSLVSDQALQINFVVEAGSGTYSYSGEGSEQSDSNLSLDKTTTSPDGSSPVFNPSEENSNSSMTLHEEPKYVDGRLAVCPNCGISSIDFNRCQRCKRKLPDDVKSVPQIMAPEAKKEKMLAVDTFYKKNNEQNRPLRVDRDGSVPSKRGRGRGGRPATKARFIREPECLTISSDEDDQKEGKLKKSGVENSNSMSAGIGNIFNQTETEMILEKEPVITNNSVSNFADYDVGYEEGIKSGCKEREYHTMTDGSILAPHTSLTCRTVRIGSYKYIPQEKVIISQSGVRLGVPLLEDNTNFVPLEVKMKDIVKVLIHFGKAMPVLFFYTTTNAAGMIREMLGMQDPKGPYYDPAGKDHTHKRITLLPEKLTEEGKIVLKSLFAPLKLLEELNSKEANDILVRASPKDSWQVQSLMKKSGQPMSTSNSSSNGGIQTIMVYPPPPAKGGIAINTEDYACLGEDQFLNDVIIDFYLKYLTLEILSNKDQNRTHVFSSYFYKRLTSPHAPAADCGVPLSPAAKRHARVQKWTKNVNIFEKDFIIIPINEHAHWFLAIICFPGFVGKVPIPQTPKENDVKTIVKKSKKAKEAKLQAVTVGSTTITPVTATITLDPGDEGSERDEAEGDDEEMEMDSDEEEETEGGETGVKTPQKPRVPTPVQNEFVKLPCILIFDSLAGASRSRVVATLRDYLSCEYLAKMGVEKIFSKDTIKGACPKVPQQSNFTDCGVYLLQYVESFFSDPIKNYSLPIKTLKNWFEEIIVTRKREELSKLLVRIMNATKGDRIILLPVLTFPTQEGRLLQKAESNVEIKSVKAEAESKKKAAAEMENRSSSTAVSMGPEENMESTGELLNSNAHQILSHSPQSSSSSNENSQTEMFADGKTLNRSSSDTMSYLKAKRIPRLMQRTSESQDDKQISKKHKGDSFDSCK